jgi:hypothetical protein
MRWTKENGREANPTSAKPEQAGGRLPADGHEAEVLETEIVARDRRRKVLATVRLEMSTLQAEAESAAAGSGDPVILLAEAISWHLAEAGAEVRGDDRTALESALSAALVAGEWPGRLEVLAAGVRSRSPGRHRSVEPEHAHHGIGPGVVVPSPSRTPDGRTSASLPPELFESYVHYPSDNAHRVYESLIGLDIVKERLVKEAIILTQPERLQEWCRNHHGSRAMSALEAIRYGTPLFIFSGDVGTGKSALAETFGDAVARTLGQRVSLLRMSIQTRGTGIVGDMTRQISRAFRAVEAEAGRTGNVTILLLDEADALAESRETQQMHHEDRAGVNALLQGVDHLRGAGVPALVVFCSNRIDKIDPAVLRRAVDVVPFRRPDAAQRRAHLERLLGDLDLTEEEWQRLVDLTGPREGSEYGFTYSDVSDRLVRKAVLEAFPDSPLSFAVLERVAEETVPTRPFGDAGVC